MRAPKADILIWLDLSRWTCIWRVLKRITLHHGKTRDDLPPGCVDRFDWNFLKWVWNFNKNSRPPLEKLYLETKDQLQRFHLQSQQEVDKFIEMMKAESSMIRRMRYIGIAVIPIQIVIINPSKIKGPIIYNKIKISEWAPC